MLSGGFGGAMGGLNAVGSIAGLGSGLIKAGIGAQYGNASLGFQIGDMAGGIAGGGIDDFGLAIGKGALHWGAIGHAARRVGVEGGFTLGGGAVGYAATGTMDGALMGASMGQAIGGAFGNFAVACFTAGTPLVVDMEGNSRPINEIEVGDFVLARSEFDPDGPLELKRVEEKFVRTAVVMELVVHGQSIKTTAEHPFFVPAQGKFVAAGALQVGEQLVGHDGKLVQIASIGSTGEVTKVYNLRVADFHTYFVGGALWGWDAWVHNASKSYISGSFDELGKMDGHQNHHLLQQAAFPNLLNKISGPVIRVKGSTAQLNSQHNLIHRALEGFWGPHRNARTTPLVSEYLDAVNKAARASGFGEKAAYQMTRSAERFLQKIDLGLDDFVPQVPGRFPTQFLPGGTL